MVKKIGYSRREFLNMVGIGAAALALPGCNNIPSRSSTRSTTSKPNFIIIFTDDQGYRDVGCFGATKIKTPNLDRMAAEGMKFTDFYSAAPVCSPSRAALLTGCYPPRVGIPYVLFPDHKIGLNPQEITIAEILKEQGYATACFGKWHLGHLPKFLPRQHGFDYYFGLPYSNDMRPENTRRKYPPLPVVENETTIETNPDQRFLTKRYTEKCLEFIRKHQDQPFFIYLPHNMPHLPLFVSDQFKNKSAGGIYGDAIEEIDWGVGEIFKTLKQRKLDENTLVIFTSDNGALVSRTKHSGAASYLRSGKSTTYEGGMREPCIMRWPGKIPAGTECKEICATIDILPTLTKLAGGKAPADRVIDGADISSLLFGQKGAKSPHDAFFYYRGTTLQAIRVGKWKLRQVPTKTKPGQKRDGSKSLQTELYDLDQDISEKNNLAVQHPEIVEQLSNKMQEFNRQLKQNSRPAGKVS